jgi:hypothetical protein
MGSGGTKNRRIEGGNDSVRQVCKSISDNADGVSGRDRL